MSVQSVDPNEFVRADFAKLDTYTPVKPLHVLAEEIGVPVEKLVKLDANEVCLDAHSFSIHFCYFSTFEVFRTCMARMRLCLT